MRKSLADRSTDRIFGGFYVRWKYGNFPAASIEGAADFPRACPTGVGQGAVGVTGRRESA
jgi:hypothetical protein